MSNVVNLRRRVEPQPITPTRHPSVYDRTAEPKPALSMDEATTVPLTLNGVEWSLVVGELRNSNTYALRQLGELIARQIRDHLEVES